MAATVVNVLPPLPGLGNTLKTLDPGSPRLMAL